MKIITYLLLFVVVFITSCSSGKSLLENGDYYASILKVVDRLRKNPDHKKSQETLKEAYPAAIRFFEDDIKNVMASNNPLKWKHTIASYEKINSMYQEIRRSPGALKIVPNPINHYDKLEQAKQNAAEESYKAGLRSLKVNERNSSKAAYHHFADADNFVRGYKDVNEKMREARALATLKVLVQQIPVPQRYSLSGDFFQDKVEQFLNSTWADREFIKFFTPRQSESEFGYDQILVLAFDDYSIGNSSIRESTETFEKDSVKVGEVKVEGKKQAVYGTVKAKLTTVRKEVLSEGLLSMQIINTKTTAALVTEKFPGRFVWFSEWGSFNGDERALTNKQLAVCKRSEIPPPPPQELFTQFTVPIYTQLTNRLQSFYSTY